jgi:hypothetical protein
MKSEKSQESNVNYTLSCVYQNGKLHRSGLGANGAMSEILKWNGQLVTSLMNTLNLRDYIQTIKTTTPDNLHEKLKELKYPFAKLCELLGLDVGKFGPNEILDYFLKIHAFAIWLCDLINAKNHALDWFRIDLSDVTMEYHSSKEFENSTLVSYNSANIFILAQIEFAEYYKLGIPYIVCQKCNTIYFTHKIKSTKTCPFCESPSLDKNRRSIDKQAERIFEDIKEGKIPPNMFESKFINYLIEKKGYSENDAHIEYLRQLNKRNKEANQNER